MADELQQPPLADDAPPPEPLKRRARRNAAQAAADVARGAAGLFRLVYWATACALAHAPEIAVALFLLVLLYNGLRYRSELARAWRAAALAALSTEESCACTK